MTKTKVPCDWCGQIIERYPSQIKSHNFCCKKCMSLFQSKQHNPEGYAQLKDFTNIRKHMSQLNQKLNPTRMTLEVRQKLHEARSNGACMGYKKSWGVHLHRHIAESILGRKLLPTEVVHHIDRDKQNNDPHNLLVLSQAEHARLHNLCKHDKEVITDAFQATRLSVLLYRTNHRKAQVGPVS